MVLLSDGYAQDEDCLFRLEEAENLFNTGVFENIPDILEQCIKTFDTEDRQKAYRLVILAQYLNDDITAAEETMHNLLKEFPDYQPDINDLADYQLVYRSFRAKNVFDIGGFVGPVLCFGSIIEPWSPFSSTFVYKVTRPGIVAGIHLNVPITSIFSINSQPSFNRYKYELHYEEPINGIYIINQSETQMIIHLPVHAQFTFFKKNVQPYIKVGGTFGLLLASESESSLERINPGTGEIINSSENIKRDHLQFRNKIYYYAGGGIGLKINLNKFYLFAEVDYQHPLPLKDMLETGGNRFDQPNLWTEGWMDSDFRIINTSMRIGIAKSFYQIKKIR